MESYCVKCRQKTPTSGATVRTAKNGTRMRAGRCVVCGSKKSQIVGRKDVHHGGDIQKALGRLAGAPWARYSGEKHLPGYSFCGPGTRLDIRLNPDGTPKQGEEPVNRVDRACLRHDLAYARSDDLRSRQLADVELIHDINAIQGPTLGERLGGFMTKTGMKGKIAFGGGHGRKAPRVLR